jgi:hypothetical protein
MGPNHHKTGKEGLATSAAWAKLLAISIKVVPSFVIGSVVISGRWKHNLETENSVP